MPLTNMWANFAGGGGYLSPKWLPSAIVELYFQFFGLQFVLKYWLISKPLDPIGGSFLDKKGHFLKSFWSLFLAFPC